MRSVKFLISVLARARAFAICSATGGGNEGACTGLVWEAGSRWRTLKPRLPAFARAAASLPRQPVPQVCALCRWTVRRTVTLRLTSSLCARFRAKEHAWRHGVCEKEQKLTGEWNSQGVSCDALAPDTRLAPAACRSRAFQGCFRACAPASFCDERLCCSYPCVFRPGVGEPRV